MHNTIKKNIAYYYFRVITDKCCTFYIFKLRNCETHTFIFTLQAKLYEWYLQQCAAEYDL